MNLTRRRCLMLNNDDGNLFSIRNIKLCGYNAIDLTTYAPKVDGSVIWNGGVTGSANGGYIYISVDGINKISFYADVQFTDTTSQTWQNGLAIYGFNDINSNNLMTDRRVLYNITIPATDSSVSFTVDVSGYKYAGFAFGAKSRYIMGLSNIQVEYGDKATTYEPYKEPITTYIYLDEPLRKKGEYADYIEFKKGKVFRKVSVIDDSGEKTINESFEILQTAIEENIALPEILTHKGTNVITVDTELQPSSIKYQYYKGGK